jgi:hypothetical protein
MLKYSIAPTADSSLFVPVSWRSTRSPLAPAPVDLWALFYGLFLVSHLFVTRQPPHMPQLWQLHVETYIPKPCIPTTCIIMTKTRSYNPDQDCGSQEVVYVCFTFHFLS